MQSNSRSFCANILVPVTYQYLLPDIILVVVVVVVPIFNKSLCSDTLTLHRPRASAPRLPLLVLFQPLHAIVFCVSPGSPAPGCSGFGGRSSERYCVFVLERSLHRVRGAKPFSAAPRHCPQPYQYEHSRYLYVRLSSNQRRSRDARPSKGARCRR